MSFTNVTNGWDDAPTSQFSNLSKLDVRKVILAPAEGYKEQYIRSIQPDTQNENVLQQLVNDTGTFTDTSRSALERVGYSFLKPSTGTMAHSTIEHGWGEKRFRFYIEVRIESAMANLRQLLTGYTDHCDLSHDGKIDENTRFYINNVVDLVDGEVSNNTLTRIRGSNQLLRRTMDLPQSGNLFQDVKMLRPTDVAAKLEARDYAETLDDDLMPGESWGSSTGNKSAKRSKFNVKDARGSISSQPGMSLRLSRRQNLNPVNYLSDVLSSYIRSKGELEGAVSNEDIYESTSNYLLESNVSDVHTLNVLQNKTRFIENESFTLKELNAISTNNILHPECLKIADVTPRAIPIDYTEDWSCRTGEKGMKAEAAAIVASTLPSIATELLLYKFGIVAHNNTLDGQVAISPIPGIDIRSFDNHHTLNNRVTALSQQIVHGLFPALTMNGTQTVQISIMFDLLSESTISISINNSPESHFTVPLFADSNFSSIMSANDTSVDQMADEFSTIFDERDRICDEGKKNNFSNQTGFGGNGLDFGSAPTLG
jgi:hypothetical protein